MLRSLVVLTTVLGLFSCQQKKEIVRAVEIEKFLVDGITRERAGRVHDEIRFWQARLERDSSSYVNKLELAVQYLQLFRLAGEVIFLRMGDSLLKSSSAKLKDTDPEILYALSQLAISQHQFRQAANYSNQAESMKGDLFTVQLLQFDANMELGQYQAARANLDRLQDKSSFDYLVREAKWKDHMGQLDEAISLMEQAYEKVPASRQSLFCWVLSNLGDMYGHAGRVEEAYQSYLTVLRKDPANLYCLKGIAWIAFSHDRNTKVARRILDFIQSQVTMPDILLMQADIAAFEDNEADSQHAIDEFVTKVSQDGYGNMYNKYLVDIYNEKPGKSAAAEQLARQEVMQRFTPETCDMMAWSFYKQGKLTAAYQWAASYVYNRNFEPNAVMHTAMIFAASGRKREARKLLKECLDSSFELGPVTTGEIEKALSTL